MGTVAETAAVAAWHVPPHTQTTTHKRIPARTGARASARLARAHVGRNELVKVDLAVIVFVDLRLRKNDAWQRYRCGGRARGTQRSVRGRVGEGTRWHEGDGGECGGGERQGAGEVGRTSTVSISARVMRLPRLAKNSRSLRTRQPMKPVRIRMGQDVLSFEEGYAKPLQPPLKLSVVVIR